MNNLILILLLTIFSLYGCSNPEEEAKKLGFENAMQMKEIQSKGFQNMEEFKLKNANDLAEQEKKIKQTALELEEKEQLLSKSPLADLNSENFIVCNAQVALVNSIAENNELKQLTRRTDRFYKGLVYIQKDYMNSTVTESLFRKRNSYYYSDYRRQIQERTSLTEVDLENIIIRCENLFQNKVDAACSGKEYICYGEETISKNKLQANSSNLKDECNMKITELGNSLLGINQKIRAMPPLANIYTSLSSTWEKARSARDNGNYQECVRLNDIGLSTAKLYTN